MNLKVKYEENPSLEDLRVLAMGIENHAKIQKRMPPIEPFAFFIRDENEKILGGCNGIFYYGCMYIEHLWFDELIRNQGYGSKCLKLAEELAQKKNMLFITVNTMDWEALPFYIKHEFNVILKIDGYLHDSTLYILRKDLFMPLAIKIPHPEK